MTLGDDTLDEGESEEVMFKILVATDVHLGYGEKNPEIAMDSFNAFKELLAIGTTKKVDMVLLGGDLFHENKPSRSSEIRCMQILREYALGDDPVQIEYLSDPAVDFAHCNSKSVNYENPNLNIGLPIFSVHGNHDDPVGLGGHSCLDLVHEAGLVNYFGKVSDLKHIKVRPILLRKANVKVALYGLSHVKDERLHRLFRENKVEFETPSEDPGSWCNILVLHQNRAKRSTTGYIPESFIPDFFHLVIWGHEHDCRIDLEHANGPSFWISQPGSTVATSLCEGEAIEKKVGVLSIKADTQFKMEPEKLKTVRPFVMRTIPISDLRKVDLTEPDQKKLSQDIETHLKYEVEEMLHEAEGLVTGHPHQGKKPLLRLRVEYTDESQQLNPGRFGNYFVDRVANPSEILKFKKTPLDRKVKDEKVDAAALGGLAEENLTMEDLIKEYFDSRTEDKQQLAVLSVANIGAAVKSFIDKDDTESLQFTIDKQMEKQFNTLMNRQEGDADIEEEMEDEDSEFDSKRAKKVDVSSKYKVKEETDELFDDDIKSTAGGVIGISSSDEDIAEEVKKPARGRGGSRGGRGRGGGRGASVSSPAKKTRGGARGGAAKQSTIAAAFARSQQPLSRSQQVPQPPARRAAPPPRAATGSQSRNRKQMFASSDSDEDILDNM